VWRSPQGHIFLVNATGTHPLGCSNDTHRIWRAAKAPPDEPAGPTSRAEQIARSVLEAYVLAG
jgi:hypothetical protein